MGKNNQSRISYYRASDKIKHKFAKDSLDRWTGQYIEVGGKLKDIRFSYLSDLWNYHNFVVFKSSRYKKNYSILI